MSTRDNLAEAFAGESQANRKYLAFAKQAEVDGYPQVARLFRAAAHAETIHAHAHLRAMGGIKKTAENLEEAIAGEGFEFQKMYPPYLEEAKREGDRLAEICGTFWPFPMSTSPETLETSTFNFRVTSRLWWIRGSMSILMPTSVYW